jgi:hypothetical protein
VLFESRLLCVLVCQKPLKWLRRANEDGSKSHVTLLDAMKVKLRLGMVSSPTTHLLILEPSISWSYQFYDIDQLRYRPAKRPAIKIFVSLWENEDMMLTLARSVVLLKTGIAIVAAVTIAFAAVFTYQYKQFRKFEWTMDSSGVHERVMS